MEEDQYDEVLERFERVEDEDFDDLDQRREILTRVAHEVHEVDALREKQQRLWFGLTAEQKYELIVAFRVVSGGKDAIPAQKVEDLLLAMGISMMPGQLKSLLDGCIRDRNGEYSCSTLETAIDKVLSNQVQIRDVKRMFETLSENGEVPAFYVDGDDDVCPAADHGADGEASKRSVAFDDEPKQAKKRATLLPVKDAAAMALRKSMGLLGDLAQAVTGIENFQDEERDPTISKAHLQRFLNHIMLTMNEEDQMPEEEVAAIIAEISLSSTDEVTLFDFVNMFRVE